MDTPPSYVILARVALETCDINHADVKRRRAFSSLRIPATSCSIMIARRRFRKVSHISDAFYEEEGERRESLACASRVVIIVRFKEKFIPRKANVACSSIQLVDL